MNRELKNNAFTLVELAIVLIIIGLITGGLVGAQSLIESSKISSTIQQIQKMNTAINAFEHEFDEMPGDMTNAYDYFGSRCGNNTNSYHTGCNGDGDKCIDGSTSQNCVAQANVVGDQRKLLLHLSLSEIMPELFRLVNQSTETNCSPGVSFETSEFGGIYQVASETPSKYYMYYYNYASVNHNGLICDFVENDDLFTPKQLKKIDMKLDDGNAISGRITSIWNPEDNSYSSSDCANTTSGQYNLTNNEKNCGMRAELR